MVVLSFNLKPYISDLNKIFVLVRNDILGSDVQVLFLVVNFDEHLGQSEVFYSLTVSVVNYKLFAKVAENSSAEPKRLCDDEWDLVLSAVLSHLLWCEL